VIPSSDHLEAYLERLQALDKELAKLKSLEVTKSGLIAEIKTLSKDWLRLSETLRAENAVSLEALTFIDDPMKAILQSTNSRTRASAYRTRIEPIIDGFTDRIVIPVIRYEGSPTQVAARQLLGEFSEKAPIEEFNYLEEAARCLGSRCNRAAIILLWAAAIARLHGAVEKIGFNAYNEALERTTKLKGNPFNKVWKATITSLPELQRSRDFDLIVVGMDLWKYDLQVFEELDRLLGIRNSAAHPGMLRPSALDVQQYASKIATYVFQVVAY
jgi:hypothetical protein